ncbi:MAG: hypothetical protein D6761_04525 [Candidatus Dadabacteria bacterium]|nr:MAG: hypothetical protein D6761_04525 [Candidatus Dadabacteria bacterium]
MSAAVLRQQQLDAEGFSVCLPFQTDHYNAAIADVAPGLVTRLPPGQCAVLLGNTRASWPRFLRTWKHDPSLRASSDPFDRWVEQTLTRLIPDVAERDWYWGHAPVGERPSLLHAASAAGIPAGPAWIAAHPDYGPWFALRAVVILRHVNAPSAPATMSDMDGPCDSCRTKPCRHALEQVRARSKATVRDTGDFGDDWQDWVRIRDACPVGQAWRYDNPQLEYHYTKRRAILDTAAEEL